MTALISGLEEPIFKNVYEHLAAHKKEKTQIYEQANKRCKTASEIYEDYYPNDHQQQWSIYNDEVEDSYRDAQIEIQRLLDNRKSDLRNLLDKAHQKRIPTDSSQVRQQTQDGRSLVDAFDLPESR